MMLWEKSPDLYDQEIGLCLDAIINHKSIGPAPQLFDDFYEIGLTHFCAKLGTI